MNDAVVIQQVHPGKGMEPLLMLVHSRHVSYCTVHEMDYWCFYSDVTSTWPPENGGWAKLLLIRKALQAGYTFVIWLDADTLIKDLTTDLREGCPLEDVGAVEFIRNTWGIHRNVGALYLRNTTRNNYTIDMWLSCYPGTPPQHEQAVCNESGSVTIPPKWNYVASRCTPVTDPVVLGFHDLRNISDKLGAMKQELAQCQ